MSHSPDEAQLTAYLLGELSPEETAQVEAQLAVSAALRDELAGLRQTVTALEAALAAQTPPAVPALDREKLHSLLQSAVVTSADVTSGVGRAHLPVRLEGASEIVAPARGSTSRGWLVAAAVLVVGGLVGLSQMEPAPGPSRYGLTRSDLRRGRDNVIGLSQANHSGVTTPVEQEMAQLIEQYNDLKQQKRFAEAGAVAQQALALDPNNAVAVQMDLVARFAQQNSQSLLSSSKEDSFYMSLQDVEQSAMNQLAQSGSTPTSQPFEKQRPRRLSSSLWTPLPVGATETSGSGPVDGLAAMDFGTTSLGLDRSIAIPTYADGTTPGSSMAHLNFVGSAEPQGLAKQQSSFGRQAQWFGEGSSEFALTGRYGTDDAAEGRGGVAFDFRGRRSSARGLQREKELTDESLMIGEGDPTQFFDQLSLYDMDGEADLDQVQSNLFSLMATPRIIVPEQEESLALSRHPDPSDDSKLPELQSEAKQVAQQPALTVANYENGFAHLGKAVRGWEEFSQQHWSFQRDEALSRGTEAAQSVRPELRELKDLSQVVADQTRALQELRERTPENAEKPLAEVDAKAAQEAQLALVRVSRELQRQQRVWYYREGYIRDLEATIAAAEQYAHVPENDFVTPEAQPLSTFGVDVDTASYSNVRRFVESGQLPPPDAVRIEELINSFQYDGPKVEGEHPLAVAAEVSACPWQPQHQLLRVALKGKSIDLQQRPPARLVFLVDTSGSMSDENKLPLVKQSLRILVEQLREQDRLSIVTYSDNAGLLLDSTGGDKRETILAAIEGLHSDGSTNGEAGLKLAYEVAVKQFGEGATNRVMLCTDGDFNVGESADSELVKLIEKQRQTGVFLNIFGFGSGNLKDAKLEAIADKGNGQYIYIDGIKEARKTLLNELTGTLYTIAKDVKLQIEFNPNLVGSYRLVGYENRAMAAKDFSNDKVDSGDMGAGHSVVALYEIVPPGAPQPVAPQPQVEPLKYKRAGSVSARREQPAAADKPAQAVDVEAEAETPAPPADPVAAAAPAAEAPKPADPLATELCTIRVRYKQPTSNESTKIETVVSPPAIVGKPVVPISHDHVWATAVAQFGLLARHSAFVGTGNYSQVLELAQSAIGDDPTGQRREFVTLVRQMQSLSFERERQLAEISRRAEEHRRVIEEIKTVEKVPDVMTKASCSGKYRTLLRRIEVADDQPLYGEFKDWGRWEGAAYKNHQNLPHGYWVYVAPHWYIWGESTEQAAVDTTK